MAGIVETLALELAITIAKPIIIKMVQEVVKEVEKNFKFRTGDAKLDKAVDILINQIITKNNITNLTEVQKSTLKDGFIVVVNDIVKGFNKSGEFKHKSK